MAYGHRPIFPPRRFQVEKISKVCNPAILQSTYGAYTVSTRDRIYHESDTAGVVSCAADNNLLLISSKLASVGFSTLVNDIVADRSSKVICDRGGRVRMIRIYHRGRTVWIVDSEVWGYSSLSDDMLKDIAGLFEYVGYSRPTPSSVGIESLVRTYSKNSLGYHTALPLACERFIADNCYYGVFFTSKFFERVHSASLVDKCSAYLSKFLVHPTGTPEYFVSEGYLSYPIFFVHCYVIMFSSLSIGLFQCRNDRGEVYMPTEPGIYETYLWKSQVDDCIDAGCSVHVLEGWGWKRFTSDNAVWAEWSYVYRKQAPTAEVEQLWKKCTVAAIGRMSMGRKGYVLVPPEKRDHKIDWCALDGHNPIDLWVHPEINHYGVSMPHWGNSTIIETNRDVLKFSRPFSNSGSLIMIDYDSVMTVEESGDEGRYIHKRSIESITAAPGTWLWSRQHNVRLLGDRLWVSDEQPNRNGKNLEALIAKESVL